MGWKCAMVRHARTVAAVTAVVAVAASPLTELVVEAGEVEQHGCAADGVWAAAACGVDEEDAS